MSRYSLHRPRRYRAACHRPATDTRLLPSLFPSTIPHLNPHYKRCPKALRLRLRSDQSPSRPLHGRSPDKTRHSLSKGHCQVRAPLTRRIRLASSGDAPEHGVMSLPRAIVPFPDSPAADLAGQSEQSDNPRLKTNAPFKDSTVVTIGELRSTNAGHGSTLPSLGMVEHFWWTGLPHTENFSGFVHIPSEVRGKDSTVVTIGEFRSTNGGHGSPLPSLGVVEHFWWTGLPHTENFSGLVHIPSEVRGCRRAVADLTCIGTGVDAFLRNRPGPSITSLPLAHFPTGDDRPVAQGVGAPIGASTPLPLPFTIPRLREESRTCPLTLPPLPSPHSRKEPPISPSPPPSSQGKSNSPAKQSKPTTAPAHQSKLPLPTSKKGAARPLDPTIF